MRKRMRFFLLLFAAGFALVGLLVYEWTNSTRSWDVSNLEAESGTVTWEKIGFHEAADLEARLTGSSQTVAEERLRALEREISQDTGSATYFQVVGEFSFPEIQALRGTLTTLVVVADQPEPYIYRIQKPVTEVSCAQQNVAWTQMDSNGTVGLAPATARLAATGYIALAEGDTLHAERLSNTVYPVFTVHLEDQEGRLP